MVRAKMRCVRKASITTTQGYGPPKPVDVEEVEFVPVSGPENAEWSRWTPSGSVKMQITNPAVVGAFEVGKDYFVDFTPSPPVEAPPAEN
jgi:hypothetical protein